MMPVSPFAPILLLLALLSGCGPEASTVTHPGLATLPSTQESHEFGFDHWLEQARADTPTWNRALKTCRQPDRRNLPNCGTVQRATYVLSHLEEGR